MALVSSTKHFTGSHNDARLTNASSNYKSVEPVHTHTYSDIPFSTAYRYSPTTFDSVSSRAINYMDSYSNRPFDPITKLDAEGNFVCQFCSKVYRMIGHLYRHIRTKHQNERHAPERLIESTNRANTLFLKNYRSERRKNDEALFHCPDCHKVFQLKSTFVIHRKNCIVKLQRCVVSTVKLRFQNTDS